MRSFKEIICVDISEFESSHPSHAVQSPRALSGLEKLRATFVRVSDSVTSSFTPSPIQERQQGSGDRDEIRKAEHALLALPPTSRPASPRERRPRARPRSSPPTRRATRRG